MGDETKIIAIDGGKKTPEWVDLEGDKTIHFFFKKEDGSEGLREHSIGKAVAYIDERPRDFRVIAKSDNGGETGCHIDPNFEYFAITGGNLRKDRW